MNDAYRATHVEQLFPTGVVAFDLMGAASPDELFPSERDSIAAAVQKRAQEFAAGRKCARAALSALGFDPAPILSGDDRMPRWPAGSVGSISHTSGYCIAAAGLQKQFSSLGVDVERVGRVTPNLFPLIMVAAEIAELERLEEAARQQAATLIFSAKEAFYKSQYPLTRCWLGFEDVVVTIGDGEFTVTILRATHPLLESTSEYRGRFHAHGDLVVTAVAMPPAS